MGQPPVIGDDPCLQHLRHRQRQLLRGDGDPGRERERSGLAVDQSQRCCLPNVDVCATTAADGTNQVLLPEMLRGPHNDLGSGAICQRVDLQIQEGGTYCGQLVGDRFE
jgi:hypothetical protein